MKIAIFGDSYADKNTIDSTWVQYLETIYGHEVESFGESGSSILFSAKKLLGLYHKFDFCIWAVSNPPRITLEQNGMIYHITNPEFSEKDFLHSNTSADLKVKIKAGCDYLKHIFNWEDGNLQSKSLIEYVRSQVPNLMIIPCFQDPFYTDDIKKGFNLFDLFREEIHYYYPEHDYFDLPKNIVDIRKCHLTNHSHQILAKLIVQDLSAKIFTANFSDFKPFLDPIEKVFIRNDI